MKLNNQISKSFLRVHFSRFKRTLAFLFSILLTLLVFSKVYAEAVFAAYTGPTWLNPGYQFTVNLTTLTNPHKYIGLSYSVSGGPAVCIDCTCTAPACNPATGSGTWDCTIPTSFPNASIAWDISAYPNVTCGGAKTTGYTGSFTTSPTGIRLTSLFAASSQRYLLLGILALAAVMIAAILVQSLRRKSNVR